MDTINSETRANIAIFDGRPQGWGVGSLTERCPTEVVSLLIPEVLDLVPNPDCYSDGSSCNVVMDKYGNAAPYRCAVSTPG